MLRAGMCDDAIAGGRCGAGTRLEARRRAIGGDIAPGDETYKRVSSRLSAGGGCESRAANGLRPWSETMWSETMWSTTMFDTANGE